MITVAATNLREIILHCMIALTGESDAEHKVSAKSRHGQGEEAPCHHGSGT